MTQEKRVIQKVIKTKVIQEVGIVNQERVNVRVTLEVIAIVIIIKEILQNKVKVEVLLVRKNKVKEVILKIKIEGKVFQRV